MKDGQEMVFSSARYDTGRYDLVWKMEESDDSADRTRRRYALVRKTGRINDLRWEMGDGTRR